MKSQEKDGKNPSFEVFWAEMDREFFTPLFNKFLLAIAGNPGFYLRERVLALLVLYSWGQHKSHVTRSQTEIAGELGLTIKSGKDKGKVDVRRVNEAVLEFERLGILTVKGIVIIPNHKPTITPFDPPFRKKRWKMFCETVWAVGHPQEAKRLAEIEKEAKPLRTLRINVYRNWSRDLKAEPPDVPNATDTDSETPQTPVRDATEKTSDTPRSNPDDLSINRARAVNLKQFGAASDSGDDSAAADQHACMPLSEPRLAALRDILKERVIRDEALEEQDAYFVTQLRERYDPVEWVAYVAARARQGSLPTGVVFGKNYLPAEFITKVKHDTARRKALQTIQDEQGAASRKRGVELARETIADPTASEADKNFARAYLGEEAKGAS